MLQERRKEREERARERELGWITVARLLHTCSFGAKRPVGEDLHSVSLK